ncbi:hypothetical protein [Streptacidiphilus carbonis]|uniref:hypothetical protein n=1 Tax=Streptacidiphilus carbonis TaxID=105422 RepID=UPI0005A8476A|nr:hypothetical protein [Streptacidiphilus carbonis]
MSSAFHGSGLGGRPLGERGGQRSPSAPPAAPPADAPPQGTVADSWQAATESPEQRAIAARIYAELKAGADVDQVRHLIGQLEQTVKSRARSVGRGRR